MTRIAMALLCFAALTSTARAASAETAEEMLASCRAVAEAPIKDGKVLVPASGQICWGAFAVITDMAQYADAGTPPKRVFKICGPKVSTRPQMIAIFVEYVDRHPERRADPFTDVVITALQTVWPCKAETSPH
jgi:hypothetical protein